MKPIDSNLKCSNCATTLRPIQLICDSCGIKVEGPFQLNEFATLGAEDLHFLRIFVRSEGRIRDMEAALGLSYPTVRTRLTALKNKLQGEPVETAKPKVDTAAKIRVKEILNRLHTGEISFEDAMKQIKQTRSS